MNEVITSVNVFAFSMKHIMFGQLYCKLLSQKIKVGSFSMCTISFKSILIQTTWQADVVAATYFASAEDMLIMGSLEIPKRSDLYPNGKHNQM